jgi:hypothetical protein
MAWGPAKLRAAAVGAALVVALLLPTAASASSDLSITQVPSATVIPAGGLLNLKITVTNHGTADDAVYAEVSSLAGHGRGADNPYQSFAASQGSCRDNSGPAYGTFYNDIVCELGPLAPGASAQITAVAKVDHSMNQRATLLPNAFEGGYQDANNSDNEAIDRITASTPPIVSGSKKIKLSGLPTGCAPSDFTFTALAKVDGVKKIKASVFYFVEGDGQTWQKTASRNRLRGTVPVSNLSNELGLSYKLVVKAKLGGGKHLTTTVTFQPC